MRTALSEPQIHPTGPVDAPIARDAVVKAILVLFLSL